MKPSQWADEIYEEYKEDPEYMTAVLMLEITEQLSKRMIEIGISQHELAKRLGVKQPFISRLLNLNQNTTIKTLVRVAKTLDLTVEVIMSEKEQVAREINKTKTEFDDILSSICMEYDSSKLGQVPQYPSSEESDEKVDTQQYAA